ncbi:MAG: SHOCT domain-containing protein [Desulfococcaceae bacterium]|jgi:hypothetical protein|nr:SHOCT domain-containing protein [Desulfococcaceae bacterium]
MKTFQKKKESSGLMSGVFTAYFILLLHVLLLAVLGCLVLFFRGFVQYMLWIFLGGAGLIGYSGYRLVRRMKEENKNLQELLRLPVFSGRDVEVSLLGGLASLRVGSPGEREIPMIPLETEILPQVENISNDCVRELAELARLYENKLITLEEFNQAKHQLLNR